MTGLIDKIIFAVKILNDYFFPITPDVLIPSAITLGNSGASFTIAPNQINKESIIYSFGVGFDISFDLALIEKYDSTIYAFDPTPRSADWINQQKLPKQFIFEDIGVAAHDGLVEFFPPENPDYIHVTNEDLGNKALEELETKKVVGVDIEGTSLDPYDGILLTIQIGTPEKTFIFDARELDLGKFKRFKDFLENSKIIKIFHNGKFDYKHIKQHFGISVCNIYDTMLTEVVLNAGIGRGYYSLRDLASKYASFDLEKAVRATFEGVTAHTKLTEAQLKYSAIDTLIMFPIFDEQIVC